MIIKNEYVQIKVGNKTFTKKNMILNTYLYRLFKSQINTTHDKTLINTCYLKFDEPLENVDYSSVLSSDDFDLQIRNNISNEVYFKKISETTRNSIKLKYHFDNNSLFMYGNEYYAANILEKFVNRKIAAIAFGYRDTNTDSDTIFAYLDTSNMNIVLNSNENLSITRVDLIQSSGVCYGFDFPLHLVNDVAFNDQEYQLHNQMITKAQLYSVGFGNTLGLMEEESLIQDVQTGITDNSITLETSRIKKVGHYPSENLQLGFYPTSDNSKYLIFKYRLYRIDNNQTLEPQYLNEYYTMSMPNENFGNLEINLKVERL